MSASVMQIQSEDKDGTKVTYSLNLPTPTGALSMNGTSPQLSAAQQKARQVVGALCVVLLVACVGSCFAYLYLQRRKRRRNKKIEDELRLQTFDETPRTMTSFGFPPNGNRRGVNPVIQVQQMQLLERIMQIASPRPGSGPQQHMQQIAGSPMIGANGLLAPASAIGAMASTPVSAGPVRTPGGTAAAPPEYDADLKDGEKMIGREGERACDTIKSPGETEAETKAKYEREMQQLYEIRTARREESRARQDRYKKRNAAKIAGDYDTLRELQQEALDAAALCEQSGSIALIRQYEARDKTVKISSANYHGVGVVRHNGSRVKDAEFSSTGPTEPRAKPQYDFPGETWEQETIDDLSLLSRQRSSSTLAGSVASGSTSHTSGSHDASQHCCQKCPQNPFTDHMHPETHSATLPTYSAISWGEAPPYSSPILPWPKRAVTSTSTATAQQPLTSGAGVGVAVPTPQPTSSPSPAMRSTGVFSPLARASLTANNLRSSISSTQAIKSPRAGDSSSSGPSSAENPFKDSHRVDPVDSSNAIDQFQGKGKDKGKGKSIAIASQLPTPTITLAECTPIAGPGEVPVHDRGSSALWSEVENVWAASSSSSAAAPAAASAAQPMSPGVGRAYTTPDGKRMSGPLPRGAFHAK